MVLGLTRPDSGQVAIFGQPPAQAVAAGQVSGMLQAGSLIENLSVREFVTLVASLYPHPLPVSEALELTGAAEFAGRPTTRLSGGQAQRARFAAALVADPDLLLLDEPTAALDVEARREFWVAMRAIAARGKTVLFATHYLEEADAFADRIVVLARGEVVADGPATEIKNLAGGRTIRATLPGADLALLATLPGVLSADRRGDAVILNATVAEPALRVLLSQFPDVRDIEVRGAGLEDVFLALTDDQNHDDISTQPQEVR
jgi:ABC-2 type transport system ATP-binding protein